MTHSPGPWIVEIAEEFSGENWLVASCGGADAEGKIVNVFVTTDHVHASEMDGDAVGDGYLISAAPELLESCESLISLIESGTLIVRPGLALEAFQRASKVAESTAAAIKKARHE